jgi:hypothetical protein
MKRTLWRACAPLLTAAIVATAFSILAAPHAAARADADPCAGKLTAVVVAQQPRPTDIMDTSSGALIGRLYATLWQQVGKDSQGHRVNCYLYRVATRACSVAGQTLPAASLTAFLGDRYTNEVGFGMTTRSFSERRGGDCTDAVLTPWLPITVDSPFTNLDDPVFGTGNYAGLNTVITATYAPRG